MCVDHVPVIGIVGGVGSGKSSVARLLAEREPIAVIDGDRAGHEVLEYPDIIERLRRVFGDAILDGEGRIVRAALGRAVFGTEPDRRNAKTELERIVHPRLREILEKHIETARTDSKLAGIILDAAVMFEAGWNELCDAIVYLDVPPEIRLERVSSGRGWDAAELARREASQLSLEDKRNRSDYVIDNSEAPELAAAELANILHSVVSQPDLC